MNATTLSETPQTATPNQVTNSSAVNDVTKNVEDPSTSLTSVEKGDPSAPTSPTTSKDDPAAPVDEAADDVDNVPILDKPTPVEPSPPQATPSHHKGPADNSPPTRNKENASPGDAPVSSSSPKVSFAFPPHVVLQDVCRGYLSRSFLGFRRQRMAKLRPSSQLTTKRRELMDLHLQQRNAATKLQSWCRAKLCRLAYLSSKPRLVREAQKRFTIRYRAAQAQSMRALVQQCQCTVQVQRVQETCDTILNAALGRVPLIAFKRANSPPQSAGSASMVSFETLQTDQRVPSATDARSYRTLSNRSQKAGSTNIRPPSTASVSTSTTLERRRPTTNSSAPGVKMARSTNATRRIINALASSIRREDLQVEESDDSLSMSTTARGQRTGFAPASNPADSWNSILTQWVSDTYSIQDVGVNLNKFPAVVKHNEAVEQVEQDAIRANAGDHSTAKLSSKSELVSHASLKKSATQALILAEMSCASSSANSSRLNDITLGNVDSSKHSRAGLGALVIKKDSSACNNIIDRSVLLASAHHHAKRSMQSKDSRRHTYETGRASGGPQEGVMMRYALRRAEELDQEKKASKQLATN